ncbi:iron-sulfur cluster carrier protein ApbC [Pseudoalteromonas sp. S16_S37]|uniref:iron-sulfur cluster carrier protein ApbC n=1 Tax=Pseudoalteromonas sp. S16_S37 TaxID=2720228 RepID=UPI00168174E2|nr:iron-sulfur cluster carrier protein ApbC [Pseudoalteromonas sp. S16_S37]MBD1583533.1 iron-sulfur cluster carrier protein ApbC [Pseudoalteromonas sp. S16_S37]
MFGLNKLFKKDNPLEQQIISELAAFKNGVFPLGINADWITNIDVQKSPIEVSLQLPFASNGMASLLSDTLSKRLDKRFDVTMTCILPKQYQYKEIKHIVLVASGKGGVGKSTTAVHIARALQAQGAKVGVLDADIYGPSIPSLFSVLGEKPTTHDNKTLNPIIKDEIKVQSIGFLVSPEDATVWRGPMASQALSQLLNETQWGEIDYLIVDMPPGTGDIQLTMTQKVPASGALIVTTPQDLALLDAQKGIAMFNKVNLPVLGVVENMSHFICTHCGEKSHVFGTRGAEQLAQRHGVPLLAEIPLNAKIREASEHKQTMLAHDTGIFEHYIACAQLLSSMLYYQALSTSTVDIVITDD